MSYLSEEQCMELLSKDRQGIVDYLCSTGYISPLSRDRQDTYLFGRTNNGRAACLVWQEDHNGCVTRDVIETAYKEIANAGLKVPFLFFGITSHFMQHDLFTFCQIPWFFERRDNPILRTLQGMNMRRDLHIPQLTTRMNTRY